MLIAFGMGAVSCGPVSGIETPADEINTPLRTAEFRGPIAPTISADIATLIVWLPPIFRSDSNSPGGNLLQERIEMYEETHPGVRVSLRIKAADGAGGLRDSLAAAAAAAPGALPDLLVLDQSNLRAAAIKGLIYPLDGVLPLATWDSYFPYAEAMIKIGEAHYGLPFAGDAIILAHTLAKNSEPERWEETYAWENPILLPLGDSRALFLLFSYYAAGGKPIDSIADAEFDPDSLAISLTWLSTMQDRQVLSPRSLQIDSFESSFLAIENIGECSVTLFSIASSSGDYFLSHLPTPDGARFSLATGWGWTIATNDPQRRSKAAELLAWLSDPEFLAEWSFAQGVIPPARDALALWPVIAPKDLVAGVSEQALLYPDDEISAFLGPILSKAARRVLLEGVLPEAAALEAAKAIRP